MLSITAIACLVVAVTPQAIEFSQTTNESIFVVDAFRGRPADGLPLFDVRNDEWNVWVKPQTAYSISYRNDGWKSLELMFMAESYVNMTKTKIQAVYSVSLYFLNRKANKLMRFNYTKARVEPGAIEEIKDFDFQYPAKSVCAIAPLLSTDELVRMERIYCWNSNHLMYSNIDNSKQFTQSLLMTSKLGLTFWGEFRRVSLITGEKLFTWLGLNLTDLSQRNIKADNCKVLFLKAGQNGIEEELLDINPYLRAADLDPLVNLHNYTIDWVENPKDKSRTYFSLITGCSSNTDPTAPVYTTILCLTDISRLRLQACTALAPNQTYTHTYMQGISVTVDSRATHAGLVRVDILYRDGDDLYVSVKNAAVVVGYDENRKQVFDSVKDITYGVYDIPGMLSESQCRVEFERNRFIRIVDLSGKLIVADARLESGKRQIIYDESVVTLQSSSSGMVASYDYINGEFKMLETATLLRFDQSKCPNLGSTSLSIAVKYKEVFLGKSPKSSSIDIIYHFKPQNLSFDRTPPQNLTGKVATDHPYTIDWTSFDLKGPYYTMNQTISTPALQEISTYKYVYYSQTADGIFVLLTSNLSVKLVQYYIDLSTATLYTCAQSSSKHDIIHMACHIRSHIHNMANMSHYDTIAHTTAIDHFAFIMVYDSHAARWQDSTVLIMVDMTYGLSYIDELSAIDIGVDIDSVRVIITRLGCYTMMATDDGRVVSIYQTLSPHSISTTLIHGVYDRYRSLLSYTNHEYSSDGDTLVSIMLSSRSDGRQMTQVDMRDGKMMASQMISEWSNVLKNDIDMMCNLGHRIVVLTKNELWTQNTKGVIERILYHKELSPEGSISLICLPELNKSMITITDAVANLNIRGFLYLDSEGNVRVSNHYYPNTLSKGKIIPFYLQNQLFISVRSSDSYESKRLLPGYAHYMINFIPESKTPILVNLTFTAMTNTSDFLTTSATVVPITQDSPKPLSEIDLKYYAAELSWKWNVTSQSNIGHFWRLSIDDHYGCDLSKVKSESRITPVNTFTTAPGTIDCMADGRLTACISQRLVTIDHRSSVVASLAYDTGDIIELLSFTEIATVDDAYTYSIVMLARIADYLRIVSVRLTYEHDGGSGKAIFDDPIDTGIYPYYSIQAADFKSVMVDKQAAVAAMSDMDTRSVSVSHPACNKTLTFAGVSIYDMFVCNHTSYLMTGSYDKDRLSIVQINWQTCQFDEYMVDSVNIKPSSFSRIKCEEYVMNNDHSDIDHISCILAGPEIYHIVYAINRSSSVLDQVSMTTYSGYKNYRYDQVAVMDKQFVLVGHRLDPEDFDDGVIYDSSGILYYRMREHGGNGFMSGGLLHSDLLDMNLTNRYKVRQFSRGGMTVCSLTGVKMFKFKVPKIESSIMASSCTVRVLGMTRDKIMRLMFSGNDPQTSQNRHIVLWFALGTFLFSSLIVSYIYFKFYYKNTKSLIEPSEYSIMPSGDSLTETKL